jgi:hypothetical protein
MFQTGFGASNQFLQSSSTSTQRPVVATLRSDELQDLLPDARVELAELADAGRGVVALRHQAQYILLDNVLGQLDAEALTKFVGEERAWELNEKAFLSKHDIVWERVMFGRHEARHELTQFEILRNLGVGLIEDAFNTVVGGRFEIKGTKMLPPQAVGIHNDSPEGARGQTENYRLLYYPNKEYVDSDGGHLLFYADDEGGVVVGGARPVFNSGVLMQLSDHSYHAVSQVHSGVRYVVAILYWGYPILFNQSAEKEKAIKCLRRIIAAGFEEKRYGSVTAADHFYHTYRLLAGWDVPFSVCLAALMHDMRWGDNVNGASSTINEREASELLDDGALEIVRMLNSGSRLCWSSGNESLDKYVGLVRLAGLLEEAEDDEAITAACRMMAEIPGLDDRTVARIQQDIVTLRAEVEVAPCS